MGYILYIEGNMSYEAIETYLWGLEYPVSRRTLQRVVDKTLKGKARSSLPGLRGGGYSEGVVLPTKGRPPKVSPRARDILLSIANLTATSGNFATTGTLPALMKAADAQDQAERKQVGTGAVMVFTNRN